MQRVAAFPVLCPARIPRAVITPPNGRLPVLHAHRVSDLVDPTHVAGLSFTYGAPWEPGSGPGWKRHAWRDRPCCFLHFEIFRRPDRPSFIPTGARPATLAGIHGLLAPAHGYGQGRGPRALYAGNHTRFLFRRAGIPYVASLHYFGGAATLALLTRLLAQLRPATALPAHKSRSSLGISESRVRVLAGLT